MVNIRFITLTAEHSLLLAGNVYLRRDDVAAYVREVGNECQATSTPIRLICEEMADNLMELE